MSNLSALEKYLYVLDQFEKRGVLDAYDAALQKHIGVEYKQLGRILDELSKQFDNIICETQGKKKSFRLIKPLDLFSETLKNAHEIGWLFHMAHEADPEIFKALEQYTNAHPDIYMFKNTPFEDVSTLESKAIFKHLQTAVKNREYRKIKFMHDPNVYDNLKCLKLIFMDNNWYLAFVDDQNRVRFGRVSFIERVEYATNMSTFQHVSVTRHMVFLKDVQNSLTLYDVPKQKALIKAAPPIARYFDADMKIFLSTQKFVEKLPDGSVIFSLEYTQPLEILPLIQRWMPHLVIQEPQELIDAYRAKLQEALSAC